MFLVFSAYNNNGCNLKSTSTKIIMKDIIFCYKNAKQHTVVETRLAMFFGW